MKRREFEQTLRAVEQNGVSDYVEELMRPPGKGGRPRQIGFAVFITAVVCLVGDGASLSLTRVHRELTTGLDRKYRQELGIEDKATGRLLTIRQVRYMLEALECKLAHTQGRASALSPEDREQREAALHHISDMLTGMTVTDHLGRPAAYAVDGTSIDSWARPHGRREVTRNPDADHSDDAGSRITIMGPEDEADEGVWSFDPDAAFGHRTKTHNNRTSTCFGYHGFALLGVPAVGADPDSWPKLVERFRLRPANANAVQPTLQMLDSLEALGRPASELLCDREFSYKAKDNWAIPLRERGIAQVMDMHDRDRGVRDYNGIAMIDGTPHCGAVLGSRFAALERIKRPANLSPGKLRKNATAEQIARHQARTQKIAQFRADIAERNVAAFRRVAGPDAEGNERWECPAQYGKVICANCPLSAEVAPLRKAPVVENPHIVPPLPDPPAKPRKAAPEVEHQKYRKDKDAWDKQADFLRCCRQRTITIPGNAVAKLRQNLAWGTDPWIASYSRRGHIEGYFGNIKSAKTAQVERGWIYVVGIVKTTIMLTAVVVATNIRLLRKWAARTGDTTHPLSVAPTKQHKGGPLDSAGNPDLALAPPLAA